MKTKEVESGVKKDEFELTPAAEFDILSKKIICKFFQNALFTRLACIDYEGRIQGQGDSVLMADHTIVVVDHAIPIDEKRDPEIFKDIVIIDLVTTRIAKTLQEIVERAIVVADDDLMKKANYIGVGNPKLYFVSQIVPMGGHNPTDYKMKYVYGFKIA